MSDIYSTTLFHCVVGRLGEKSHECKIKGRSFWLHADSVTVVELLDHLIDQLTDASDRHTLTLSAKQSGDEVAERIYVELAWHGSTVSNVELDRWLAMPMNEGLGGITGPGRAGSA